jgi:hypothetical protein
VGRRRVCVAGRARGAVGGGLCGKRGRAGRVGGVGTGVVDRGQQGGRALAGPGEAQQQGGGQYVGADGNEDAACRAARRALTDAADATATCRRVRRRLDGYAVATTRRGVSRRHLRAPGGGAGGPTNRLFE